MAPLRDVLTSRPKILFVGINPSLRSEAVGHHFAGPGNPFWRLLHAAGLTPEPLTYADDARLAELGMAITNLCPRATRAASELGREEFERGRSVLMRKISRLRPELVALVGVSLYRRLLGSSRRSSRGPGLKPDRIEGARVFVLPNPSGLNASFPSFAAKLRWFKRLRHAVARGLPGDGIDPQLASKGGDVMPDKETLEKAREDKAQGKAPTTQAGEFVREEIEHVREGKHDARSPQQAIAIGLSKARRAGVKLPPPTASRTSAEVRRKAERDLARAGKQRRPSATRSRAVRGALRRESRAAASPEAMARQAHSAAARRTAKARSAAAKKAAATKGPGRRRVAARKAARTRKAKA